MRIAFLGKGGAGKTTTSAGFVRYASQEHPFVLAVDADVNAHMRQALNVQGDIQELGHNFTEVSEFLKGDRKDLRDRPMIATTPPSLKSNFIKVSADDNFLQKYALKDGNISLLTVGSYKESDVGGSCYHTKLASLAAVFHHLLDTEDDIVIADTTAGTDNVATSLNFVYDLNVFVVEPTEKSVSVYGDFIKLAPHLAERTYVVANKVDDKDDEAFITSVIPREKVLGFIPFSKNLKRFEQGQKQALADFQAEQAKVFGAVYSALKSRKRDWNAYLNQLRTAHEKVSREWYNDFYGTKLEVDLDSDFDYERAIARESGAKKEPVLAGR